jgi:hypothetical protein
VTDDYSLADSKKKTQKGNATVQHAVLAQVRLLLNKGKLAAAARLCAHLQQDFVTLVRRLPGGDLSPENLGSAMAQLLGDFPAISSSLVEEDVRGTHEFRHQADQIG